MKKGLEKLLEKHHTTIYRVAKETGVPQTTLYEWSEGKYIPRVETLLKVAKHFDVGIEDLL